MFVICTNVLRLNDIALSGKYRTAPVIWNHTVLPTQVNVPHPTPARQTGTQFTYPGVMKG